MQKVRTIELRFNEVPINIRHNPITRHWEILVAEWYDKAIPVMSGPAWVNQEKDYNKLQAEVSRLKPKGEWYDKFIGPIEWFDKTILEKIESYLSKYTIEINRNKQVIKQLKEMI